MVTVGPPTAKRRRGALCAGLLLMAARNPTGMAFDKSEPAPVVIPQALRAHVPMAELSALIWAPGLDRYLTVVDDSIDLDDDNRRAPFVLALDRTGHIDAEPVPLDGLKALDDAEGLAAHPDGKTFYLMTSHSPTKKGKVRKSRRQLLQMTLQGRRLRVTGTLDLLEGKGDVAHQMQTLGVPGGTPVDLEGLTFHGGALYIGVKSPLLADGAAVILRLDNPGQAFADGKLSATMLSVWGRARLSVPLGLANGAVAGGATVSQGIADMFFAGDGALYLCANAPKGAAADGGGALWRVAAPRGGTLDAKVVRRFVGLKPEGVAAAPGGATLTLVFDRNSRDPLWMSWPVGPHAPASAATARRPQP